MADLKNNKIKLYKFRELATDTDLERLSSIIETGHFWCSNFWDLNDPMEGVFYIDERYVDKIKDIFNEKSKYKICSFSGEEGLKNPLLWGYYANGFKGVAIEVEVENETIKSTKEEEKGMIKQIQYYPPTDLELTDLISILTRKSNNWEHEDEYRFLIRSVNNLHKIGKITKVHFGNPYRDARNREDIVNKSEKLKKYDELKESLINICDGKDIGHEDYSYC